MALLQGESSSNLLISIGVGIFVLLSFCWMLMTRRPKGAPPTVRIGLPALGNVFSFVSSPIDLIRNSYNKYGEVFTVPMGPKKLTFLIGPEAGAPFFTARDEVLSQNEVYGFMKPVFGPDVVYDAEPKKRFVQMKTTANGLKADRLQAYVPKIEKETREFLKKNMLGDQGEVNLLDVLSDLTILTASRCLHGDDVRENMFQEVARLYHDLDKGITSLSFFLPNAPIKAHAVRDKARVEMCDLFGKVIKERRARMAAGEDLSQNTDILQLFMEMKYKDGSPVTDEQVTGLLIALLFAGQHTSSISSTWTTLLAARNTDIWKRLQEEQDRLVGGKDAPVTWDAVKDMEMLHNCMREALRMFPPLIMLMRYANQPLVVTTKDNITYTIPKGDIVVTSPAVSMRLERIFKDPDMYDPDRYAEPREEHKTPYAYLGFGGGMHQCLGQQFGFLQVKTIMSILIREFEFDMPSPEIPKPDYTAMVVGPKGSDCMCRYRRRK